MRFFSAHAVQVGASVDNSAFLLSIMGIAGTVSHVIYFLNNLFKCTLFALIADRKNSLGIFSRPPKSKKEKNTNIFTAIIYTVFVFLKFRLALYS